MHKQANDAVRCVQHLCSHGGRHIANMRLHYTLEEECLTFEPVEPDLCFETQGGEIMISLSSSPSMQSPTSSLFSVMLDLIHAVSNMLLFAGMTCIRGCARKMCSSLAASKADRME